MESNETDPRQQLFEQRRMELANYILEHPEEFDMGKWGYQTSCGTVGCLAGHAAFRAEQEGLCTIQWQGFSTSRSGMHFDSVFLPALGLSEDADDFAQTYLALPNTNLFYSYELTPETAAKALLEAPYCIPDY